MAPQDIQQPVKITLTLPTQAYFMSGVRDFILGFIKNTTKFGDMWAFRFQSIVDELCNNAIEFGSAPGKEIKLTLTYDGKCLGIIVEDSGTGKNKISAKDLQKLVDERKNPTYVNKEIRGRGLSRIVANWTDELLFEDLENSGIRVTAKKLLSQPKPEEMAAVSDKTHIVLQ